MNNRSFAEFCIDFAIALIKIVETKKNRVLAERLKKLSEEYMP